MQKPLSGLTLSREAGANVFMLTLSGHVGFLTLSPPCWISNPKRPFCFTGRFLLRSGHFVLREGFFSEAAILFYGKVWKSPFCFTGRFLLHHVVSLTLSLFLFSILSLLTLLLEKRKKEIWCCWIRTCKIRRRLRQARVDCVN